MKQGRIIKISGRRVRCFTCEEYAASLSAKPPRELNIYRAVFAGYMMAKNKTELTAPECRQVSYMARVVIQQYEGK